MPTTPIRHRISGTGTDRPAPRVVEQDLDDEDLDEEAAEERAAEEHAVNLCEQQAARRRGRDTDMDR